MLTHKERSKISEKAWKGRRPNYKCAFCHKGIYTVSMIVRGGKHYHRNCWDRLEIEHVRHKTAKRGYYKTHGG